MTLELHATPEEVMRAVEALQKFAKAHGVPEKAIFGFALSLEECGSNIVNHALQRDRYKTFQVAFEHTGSAVIIELRDRGPAFDPTAAAERKPQADDDDLPGGWGLHLVRRYMDEIRYQREAGVNVLRLAKRLAPETGAKSPSSINPHNHGPKPQTDMPLKILILKAVGDKNIGAVTIKLTGSLDTATAPDLERQLTPVLAGPIKHLVFDLSELNFISSAGLRLFSIARKQLKERGGQASFVSLQPQIQEVFEIMKSLPGVSIFKDMAEMDRYLAAIQRKHQEKNQ
jgi:anti-anti-sigma factor